MPPRALELDENAERIHFKGSTRMIDIYPRDDACLAN